MCFRAFRANKPFRHRALNKTFDIRCRFSLTANLTFHTANHLSDQRDIATADNMRFNMEARSESRYTAGTHCNDTSDTAANIARAVCSFNNPRSYTLSTIAAAAPDVKAFPMEFIMCVKAAISERNGIL